MASTSDPIGELVVLRISGAIDDRYWNIVIEPLRKRFEDALPGEEREQIREAFQNALDRYREKYAPLYEKG